MASKIAPVIYEIDVELKSPAEAVWSAIKELNIIRPKFQSQTYKSTEIVEGDGKSTGTIYLVNFVRGSTGSCGNYCKIKYESLDEENRTVIYRYLEGDILKFYKSFVYKIAVKAKDEGSVMVSTCIYEKAFFMAPEGEMMGPAALELGQDLDAYLLGNNKN